MPHNFISKLCVLLNRLAVPLALAVMVVAMIGVTR